MNTTKKIKEQPNTIHKKTKKNNQPTKLNKCSQSRISEMETYKVNCGKNLLVGIKSIKAAEETSMHKNDFVHVIVSALKNYNEPVIVKVYDSHNFHLPIERRILQKINNYRNTAHLICDFSCNDIKSRYESKVTRQIRFCGNGNDSLHFFVYEYIKYGDVGDFLTLKNPSELAIKSIILQTTCVIIQLATIYKIYHGDINSGNILVDAIHEDTIDYCIEGETVNIETGGLTVKVIDYGRSNFYKHVAVDEVWFDIIIALGVIYPYIKNNRLQQKVLAISNQSSLELPSLKDYYTYIKILLE